MRGREEERSGSGLHKRQKNTGGRGVVDVRKGEQAVQVGLGKGSRGLEYWVLKRAEGNR